MTTHTYSHTCWLRPGNCQARPVRVPVPAAHSPSFSDGHSHISRVPRRSPGIPAQDQHPATNLLAPRVLVDLRVVVDVDPRAWQPSAVTSFRHLPVLHSLLHLQLVNFVLGALRRHPCCYCCLRRWTAHPCASTSNHGNTGRLCKQ